MYIRRKGEKLFGAVILMLMTVLALSAVVLADDNAGSSYTLTIHKKVADSSTVAPNQLKGVPCTFRVEGILGKGSSQDGEPFTREVTFTLDENGEGSAIVDLGSPGVISVIELNPNTVDSLKNQAVMLTEISNESFMHVNSSNPKTEIDLGKENNWIRIKPKVQNTAAAGTTDAVKRAYKVSGTTNEGNPVARLVEITDGQSAMLENLSPGHYKIEAQKAPAGFGLEVTNPKIESKSGEEIKVNIDSNSGEGVLSIEDDGNTHYFRVDGPYGYGDSFVLPYYDANGDKQLSYQVQHVVAGSYTMHEESYAGNAAFSVIAPETRYTTQATKDYTFEAGYYTIWPTTGSTNKNDYIRLRVYQISGPAQGKNMTVRVKGDFLNPPSDGKTYVDRGLTDYKPTSAYLLGATTWTIPGEKVYFKFYDNAGVTGCKVDICLYKPRRYIYNSNKGEDKIVTVDDRRYIELTKPADQNVQAGQVTYVFTILDKDGNVVTVTDENGNSMDVVKVFSGQTVKVNVPAAGNYTVHQEMQSVEKVPFTVYTKCTQNTILQDATLTATVMGTGSTIRMSKPACEAGTDDLGREYHFRVTGPSLPAEGVMVALKAGESFKLRELLDAVGYYVPGDYQSGKYEITAIDGGYTGFDLTYSDSCTLDVVSSSASVTVTNTYQKIEGAYRVVHEYYDGEVTTPSEPNFDGRSEISLFGDKELDSRHTGDEVTKEYFFNKNGTEYEYAYVDTVYGNYGEFTGQTRSVSGPQILAGQTVSGPQILTGQPVSESQVLTDQLISGSQVLAGQTVSGPDVVGPQLQRIAIRDGSGPVFRDTGDYVKNDGMTCAQARPDGDHIIILRYRRMEKPAAATGSYHVVHRYYHRTSAGDIFEGAFEEDVISAPLDFSIRYTADTVEKRFRFTPAAPEGVPHTYTYEFDVYGLYEPGGNEPSATEDGYHPVDGKECAYATETGEEAIVLRYYRDEAAYNVVHEYYLRTPAGLQPVPAALDEAFAADAEAVQSMEPGRSRTGGEDVSADDGEGIDDEESSDGGEDSGGIGDADSAGDSDAGTAADGNDAVYDYTYEGESEVTMHTGILGDTYTGLRVKQIPEFDQYQYIHFAYDYGELNREGEYVPVPDMESATATMRGEQIIILRYYREVGGSTEPTPPPGPELDDNSPGGSFPPGGSSGPGPVSDEEKGPVLPETAVLNTPAATAAFVTNLPATGDDRHPGFWFLLWVCSGAWTGAMLLHMKKGKGAAER